MNVHVYIYIYIYIYIVYIRNAPLLPYPVYITFILNRETAASQASLITALGATAVTLVTAWKAPVSTSASVVGAAIGCAGPPKGTGCDGECIRFIDGVSGNQNICDGCSHHKNRHFA